MLRALASSILVPRLPAARCKISLQRTAALRTVCGGLMNAAAPRDCLADVAESSAWVARNAQHARIDHSGEAMQRDLLSKRSMHIRHFMLHMHAGSGRRHRSRR